METEAKKKPSKPRAKKEVAVAVEVQVPVDISTFLKDVQDQSDAHPLLSMDRMGFGAWSISKLKVLQKCPLQFYLKYVLKVKMPATIGGREESLSANVGSAGHRILEITMMGSTINDAYEKAKPEFVPSLLTDEQWTSEVESLYSQISAFKERMDGFARRYGLKKAYTELRVGVTKDWKPTSFFANDVYFRGIIDLVLLTEDDDAVIIDHKTGGFSDGSIKVYESQLNSYKPLFHYGVAKIKGSQAGIHFIRDSVVKMAWYHPISEIETKLRPLLEWEFDCAVDNVGEMGYFKHVCGSYCQWCDFSVLCKSKEKYLKPLELSTSRVIPIKKI